MTFRGNGMAQTKSELSNEIINLTKSCWDSSAEPLLLSNLGPALKSSGIDYKAILLEQGLGNFISHDIPDLKIIKHPTQYAKIGVVPATADFSYETAESAPAKEPTEQDKLRKSRRAFYGFIEAISELPPDEIEAVSIPTRVIVRLLEGK